MTPVSLSLFRSRSFVRVLGLSVLFAGLASAGAQTTITGTVYAPNGTDPLPNILVYVATPGVAVQPFATGPGTDCNHQNAVVSGNPIAEAITDYKGNFTIASPQLTQLGSTTVNLVIQAGKWRQQYPNTVITAGQTLGPLTLTMPGAAGTGADLPQIAVVTGSADAVECVFQAMGIKNTEVSDPEPAGTGHINFFPGTDSPGAKAVSTSTQTELGLMSNSSVQLSNYDMLMLGCQGTYIDSTVTATTTNQNNLTAYANQGGRIFATHYEYIWLNKPATFASVADWRPDETSITPNNGTGTITVNTSSSFPEGITLANWLQYIGASPAGAAGYGQILDVPNLRQDQTGIIAPTQSWGTLDPPYLSGTSGTPVMQFSFDTPLGAPANPTIALTFTNIPTSFLVGDIADTIQINISDNSATASTTPSLSLTIAPPTGVTVTNIAGTNANTGWACVLATLTCTENNYLTPGMSDPVTLTVSVPTNTTPGTETLYATLSGGGLSGTGQCGRVLYNEYHVEPPSGTFRIGGAWPTECPSTVLQSGAVKFLEFSLYNLSNFVAPVTSDTINIESATVTTLTNVVSPIYYGQIIANTAVEAVVGTNGNGVDGGNLNFLIDGVVVCTLPANTAGVCPPPTGQGYNAGTHTIQSVYVGDTIYLTSSSPIYNVVVLPDPTSTALTISPNPATSQQVVTLTATVSDIYAPVVGTVNFLDNGLLIGTGTVVNGVATVMLNFTIPGQHSVSACFVASLDYLGSCASVTTLIVTLPPSPDSTQTLLTSNANPSYFGQAVTFTSPVSTTGAFTAIPTGTVTYFDGATAIGTGTLDGAGNASFTASALAIGTHTMTASYAGNNSFTGSVSPQYIQVVTDPVTSAGTGFILQVTPTALTVPVGSSVIVNVTVIELNNFQQPVQLSCTGMPSEGTCNFAQSLIPATGGATVLAIGATAPHNCGSTTPYFVAGGRGMGLLWLGVTALGLFLARKRRRVLQSLALAAAMLLIPVLQGCGTGNCTDFGLQPGAYTFTVTGVSTGTPVVTQTQAMTMTVTIQ